MKTLIPILFVILLIMSCEQHDHYYCWQCKSIVYNKPITDIPCYKNITDIEDYKARLYDFYQGGMTTIECTLLPDTIGQ